ncbi:hypothetical protein [Azospira sp. I13]|uniref:hypothetical protein n=1 Tax=Azospira sp. I13 TaxID=1765050 RepID=UPI001057C8C3|nr:hypothetical protein [Azospira sp. I13]
MGLPTFSASVLATCVAAWCCLSGPLQAEEAKPGAAVATAPAPAAADSALRAQGEWMAHYYQRPDPAGVADWVRQGSAAGMFEKPGSRFPVMVFLAEIMKQNPARHSAWCQAWGELPAEHRLYLAWALRNAASPSLEACLGAGLKLTEEQRRKLQAAPRFDALARPAASPTDLDMLWAVFMATGNGDAVQRIIDVLAGPEPRQGEPGAVNALLLRGAARWSLGSNMRQHARVAALVKERRARESGPLAAVLDELLARLATSAS